MRAVGILAALNHRHESGKGQHIDLALTDCTLASLTNIAQYYLTSGKIAPRLGNAHSTIVPYQAFEAEDGHIILAVGNNDQFARFAKFVGHEDWAADVRFVTNAERVQNRDVLVPRIAEILKSKPVQYWVDGFHEVNVPCSPVNTMDQVFEMEQIQARDMQISMKHDASGHDVSLVGSPIKMSETPVRYEYAPPSCGQHSAQILKDILGKSDDDIEALCGAKVIQA